MNIALLVFVIGVIFILAYFFLGKSRNIDENILYVHFFKSQRKLIRKQLLIIMK